MLSNHSSRIYMDEEDVSGTLKVLVDAVNDHMAPEADIYYGALIALETIAGTKLRDQSEFMPILANKIESYLRQETN